jgi:hypothetical protein
MMLRPVYAFLLSSAFIAGCSGLEQNGAGPANTNGRQPAQSASGGASPPVSSEPSGLAPGPSVATGHGGAASNRPQTSSSGGDVKIDTSAYDAKIKQAETKAKASNASDADKRMAASAYLERGNVYYTAGQPSLYKFALGDFRTVLRYQPDNEEARAKIEQIVEIYNSLGRPVPTNGLE